MQEINLFTEEHWVTSVFGEPSNIHIGDTIVDSDIQYTVVGRVHNTKTKIFSLIVEY